MSDEKISSREFYREYHGHKVRHLRTLLPKLRAVNERLIWTAGDSSLDNKYWFGDSAPAVRGAYEETLQPPRCVQDVTYWLNYLLSVRAGPKTGAINAAVEATTLNERTFRLRAQDKFLRDNIREEDILIVSVGGNDVALLPLPCTIAAIAGLICMPTRCIESGVTCGVVPFDDCCCGCGSSLLSCACSYPPCLGYVRHLFGTRIQKYIEQLTAKTTPKMILVCMIYYPDEATTPSWAGPSLGALGYNRNPAKLQALILRGFQEATSRICIRGSQVIPVPLFHPLNGKISEDYVARVEPSASGGRKMAEFMLDLIDGAIVVPATADSSPPTTAYMQGRS